MTLAELGAKLREAREARNMTVADVADRLKIPGRILHGVEDASEHLPRTVYVHHFIKDYAKLMGFSAAEIAEWTASLEGFENVSRPVIAESQPFTSVKPSLLPVVLGALLKFVLAGVLAFGVYTAYVHFFAARDYEEVVPAQEQNAAPVPPVWDQPASEAVVSPSKADTPALPSADDAAKKEGAGQSEAPLWDVPPAQTDSAPAVTGYSQPETSVSASADALVSQPGFSETAPVAEEPASPAPAPADGDAGAGSGVVQSAGSSFAALPEGMHHVEVIADQDECWMGFTPDGRRQQRTLSKGDSYTMTFRDSLEVKLGNASAVRVIYDGKELERATTGRVLTLRFPPEE